MIDEKIFEGVSSKLKKKYFKKLNFAKIGLYKPKVEKIQVKFESIFDVFFYFKQYASK